MPGEAALEWVQLILAFKANKANGWGALFFNAGHGKTYDWKVESKVTVRVDSVTRKVQTS